MGPTPTLSSATPFSLVTPAPSATISSASTPTSSSAFNGGISSGGLSAGVQAGIGVGVAIVGIVAVVIAWLVFRSTKSSIGKDSPLDGSTLHTDVSHVEKQQLRAHTHEMWSNHGYRELGQREDAELAAISVPQELEDRTQNIHQGMRVPKA